MLCRAYAVVLDERGERVLLRLGDRGREIPSSELEAPRWWHVVGDVNRAFRELLGVEVTTLRCLGSSDDRTRRFYEVEPHGVAHDDEAWFDRAEVERIDLAEAEHRPWLLRALDERADDGGPLRVAWARPGWLAEAVAWIRGHVGDLTEVVQERTWAISTVLRVSTTEARFFFKAVPPVFAGEPRLTGELGARHPGCVPDLAALDPERGWMLMRDFDGEELASEALADAVRSYAELQLAWVARDEELLALGCPDRRLHVLEGQIDPLLSQRALLLPADPEGLTTDELEAVPALAERLHEACEELLAHGLPATLEHGDLHVDNVRRRDGGFLFFDWSDGCLSVPFFSLVPFLDFHEEPLDAAARERVRDAYLAPWADTLGDAALVDAFELAQFVGLFHQAVSYHRITEGTEPRARWEWERGFPFFVKRLLRSER